MENQVEKVFAKINQVWQKGEIVSQEENMLTVKIPNYTEFKIDANSPLVEKLKSPGQKFAYGEAKEKLEGAYISFNKLSDNITDSIVNGNEYIHHHSYVNDGELKESVKAIQLIYNSKTGSKLDVQLKRNVPVVLADAKAYNYQFTKEEFKAMVTVGKHVVFNGSSNDGEVFQKLAYYEPRLNDIRIKTALSEKVYFYGQKLTLNQAASMNKGEPVEITIDTKKGKKSYLVGYNPKSEKFTTKSLEKIKAIKTNEAKTVGKKKRSQHNSLAQ